MGLEGRDDRSLFGDRLDRLQILVRLHVRDLLIARCGS